MNHISIRYANHDDAKFLKKWLMDPEILKWFPMTDEREIDDAVKHWISYSKIGSALTLLHNENPVGNAILYICPFKKLAHQALFAIILDKNFRKKGLGKILLESIILLGKKKFHLELLHLEVYEKNPAVFLYEKLGFVKFGCEKRFVKENNHYKAKIMMQKHL